MARNTGHILLCGMMNPWLAWKQDELNVAGETGYVFYKEGRTRPTRIVMSAGDLGDAWELGTMHDLFEDQEGKHLGYYEVCAIVRYDEAGLVESCEPCEAYVPNRKLALGVFK